MYRSPAYEAVLLRLDRFARDDTAPILLVGESGTGKTTLARRIHDHSVRASGPFEHMVLSAIPDGVAASALFGHVVGAYTGARDHRAGHLVSARGGTLFLDELGKATLPVQAMLLHAIEYGVLRPVGADRDVRVNVRIVAATSADLQALAARGEFLPDLLARLACFTVTIPPLRERRADIPGLIGEILERRARAVGYHTAPQIAKDLLEALCQARWPDNLRQLDGVIHRLLIEADGAPVLTLGHCMAELSWLAQLGTGGRAGIAEIEEALAKTGNNVSGAARLLGITPKTLRRRRRAT